MLWNRFYNRKVIFIQLQESPPPYCRCCSVTKQLDSGIAIEKKWVKIVTFAMSGPRWLAPPHLTVSLTVKYELFFWRLPLAYIYNHGEWEFLFSKISVNPALLLTLVWNINGHWIAIKVHTCCTQDHGWLDSKLLICFFTERWLWDTVKIYNTIFCVTRSRAALRAADLEKCH